MKQQILYALPMVLGAVSARPVVMKREVPQEHSHNAVIAAVNTALQLNNPDNIQDAVFGLLGNAAAAAGQGDITDTDCLQQATADQAFSNAKEAGDVAGMTAALIYRGLERNTGSVGLASVACESIQAVNVEIAAIQQHQDPASDGAADLNKQITLAIAQQIASIGGNPQDALQAGTFAPGQVGDPTGAGNTCDVQDDTQGCIFSQNLIVNDASEDEINQAVAGVSAAAPAAGNNNDANASCAADNQAAANASAANVAASSASAASASEASASVASASAAVASASASASAADAAAAPAGAGQLDLGSCSDASIVFGAGFDGRKEDSFEPSDIATFNHGSALNIGVIADFICGQLDSKCGAGQDAISACDSATTAAKALSGQAAADAFNQGLGL